jgi:hypothetical protein
MAAIVDFDERTLAFKAVAAAFRHTGKRPIVSAAKLP